MAIVANLARTGDIVDKSFNLYNRTNAGTPNAALTPQYVGELVLDTTTAVVWIAEGLGNNTWVQAVKSRDA